MELNISALIHLPQTPAASGTATKMLNIEDSGYHTPFTQNMSELSGALDTSSGTRTRFCSIVTQDCNSMARRKYIRTPFNVLCLDEEPIRTETSFKFQKTSTQERCIGSRRSLKRSLEQSEERTWCLGAASTPTSAIAGDLEKLCVESPTPVLVSVADRVQRELTTSDYFSLSSIGETSRPLSYPTTPVKSSRCKMAKLSPRCERRSCTKNYSPLKAIKENCHPRRSVKKLNFIRSQSTKEPALCELTPWWCATVIPDRKIDIITKLYERRVPALSTILGYLSAVDIYNFSGVCRAWRYICDSNSTAKAKRENYSEYIRVTKENHDNRDSDKSATRERSDSDKLRLRDIHNVINSKRIQPAVDRSPPGTPRTNKFRKFTKSASLDGRVQVSCVRCCQPAKVTEERSGEQWAQCSSDTCFFAFCRFCKCTRHPQKSCHSLEAPSPSKRRKQSHPVIDSKKCRKNLRRLLD